MGVLSSLIARVNLTVGDTGLLYKGFYVLGFLTIFVFNFFYGSKFGIKKGKALLVTVLSFLLIFGWAFVLAWVESLLTDWGHHNAVRVYIWMPLLLFVLSKPMDIDWKRLCDFIAPSACIVYGIARLGCLFPGCCYGVSVEWGEWGIYSAQAQRLVFPVQFCEAVTALALAGFAIYMNIRKKYVVDAKTYFVMLIPYGLSRFIWEFFADNEKIFLNISSLALHALLMSVVGAAMLIILHQKEKKQRLINKVSVE